jgi:uncharacterized repeat protein (TIGR03987 family)
MRPMSDSATLRNVEVMLIAAIVLITAALGFYTWGVFAEHRAGVLRWTHAGLFALGLACDASGTWLMGRIADDGTFVAGGLAGVLTQLMAITGALALVLMAGHLAWALGVLLKGSDAARRVFHRASVAVWGIWLLPYVTGMAAAMLV